MARYFDTELIEKIKDANDIVSVISEHVPLRKKGKTYWGCCPFHNEKTPSFSVTPEKGFYYCFGCGAAGNAINFLMNYEHCTFPEALEKLANRANIPLPVADMSKEQRERNEYRHKLYEINELASNFFHNCLTQTSLGKPGLDYLLNRGLTMETIKKFKLGFAPNSWDKLYRSFIERHIQESYLLELGLCRKGSGGKVYDYFRNRVMFPIMDGRGRVVAFGGRVLDDSTPKYLNSPETSIFSKGHVLFAFDKAYPTIRSTKQAILVEGYMDVISAHNVGITNVVASLGTAYTKDHGKLLLRQAEEIILAYDMDGAGQKAAKRAMELLVNTDFKVRVLAMPDGKDPDDYCRHHGKEAFKKLVEQAVTPFEFLLNDSLIRHDSTDPLEKQAILEEMFTYISHVESSVERDNLLHALALPLWLDTNTVYRYFKNYLKKGNLLTQSNSPPTSMYTMSSIQEEDLIVAMAIHTIQAWKDIMQYVPLEDFSNPLHREILTIIGDYIKDKGSYTSRELENVFEAEAKQEYMRLMVISDNAYSKDILYQLLRAVRLRSLREQYKSHSMLADQLSRSGDMNFINELKECQKLQDIIKEWS